MKKILFVATIDEHIKQFHYPYLKYFFDRGYEVHVASNGTTSMPFCNQKHDVPFSRSPFRGQNINAYRKLKGIIEQNNYTLIHCHTPVGGALTRLAARKARNKGTKVVYTAHGFHFYRGAPLRNWTMYYPIERILSKFTDLLITINEEDTRRAEGFKACKVAKVNGVGIQLRQFVKSRDMRKQVREELNIGESDFILVSIGELNVNKNHIMAIEALRFLNEDSLVRYILVGEGNERTRLENACLKLGIADRVMFLGYREDVNRILNAADVFVFPSLREGLPVSMMEAMASKLPIVCTKIRGNIDLVDSNGGYFVDSPESIADSIRSIMKNKEHALSMGEYNSSQIKKYGVEEVVSRTVGLYRDLLRE